MSKVLAIDTSTSRTSVAIIDDGSVVFSGHRDGATAHGPSLPALVQEALAISEVDEVVVGVGPGPFTGLRVGIAFAQSFALAREIPVRGVCSLDAIAAQIGEKDFIITVDARRKEVYWPVTQMVFELGIQQLTFLLMFQVPRFMQIFFLTCRNLLSCQEISPNQSICADQMQ